jgi:hypothetical protein
MKKYRVISSRPKLITNLNRLVNLVPGDVLYLKPEAQVQRLVKLGYLKQILEFKKPKKHNVKKEIQISVDKGFKKHKKHEEKSDKE